jgi:alpha-glucosidase (family GH31 glycosyl hydrolase)
MPSSRATAAAAAAPPATTEPDWLTIRATLCAAADVKAATLSALDTLPRPPHAPLADLLRAPIWTTWARYKAGVTQAACERFAGEIASRNLPRSVLEIDDRWQASYGDLTFDTAKFPDARAMVGRLHAAGFKVTLWVMPFCEEGSGAYAEGAAKGYWVRSAESAGLGLKPGFFRWWNSAPAVALDVTNPAAVEWFLGRLRALQTDIGIDGFKFDAGEPCFLPAGFITHAPLSHPSEYTRAWVSRVAACFDVAEVRTGHRTQAVPLLTRMGDRFSEWGVDNGLGSIIPTLLTSGVLGYPFCLPDMIGGNAYFGRHPNPELMIRWAQANALMPAVQFSIAPWDLSPAADALVTASLAQRDGSLDTIVALSNAAAATLAPICRPLWWLDATDVETFEIDDQFALGDDCIVAPVVTKGAVGRDVYLTRGRWRDAAQPGTVHEGGAWLRGYPAPLDTLPVFNRVA